MGKHPHLLLVKEHAAPEDFRPWGGDPVDVEKSIGCVYRTVNLEHKSSETAWAACSCSWQPETLLKTESKRRWLLR